MNQLFISFYNIVMSFYNTHNIVMSFYNTHNIVMSFYTEHCYETAGFNAKVSACRQTCTYIYATFSNRCTDKEDHYQIYQTALLWLWLVQLKTNTYIY